jgi:N-acetylglucosaminyldiphosphoundecaprenol N-acetyl-beta-D-mannosaminyltransferase
MPFVKVLGSRVHIVSLPEVASHLDGWIQNPSGACRRLVVTGFHGLWEAHKHPDFKAILNSADLWVPDGIAPVWVARRRGFKNAARTPGAEIMKAFFELADRKGYSSFFYGDTDDTLSLLRRNVQRLYPGHKVAGTFSPPFGPMSAEQDEQIIRMINDARPDMLWVGLGLPKQDRWIHEHRDRLKVPVAAGVGAAFKFLAGSVKRVPDWIGNHGLEWLWRFACEPRKLWRRDLLDGPRFVTHVIMEMTGIRKYD